MHLADDIIVQHLADVARRRHAFGRFDTRRFGFFADDVHTQFDTFIADEHRRTGNKLADLVLAFAAERAIKSVFAVSARIIGHRIPLPCTAPQGVLESLGQGPGLHNVKSPPGRQTSPGGLSSLGFVFGLAAVFEDFVDQAPFFCVLGGHEIIALEGGLDR